MSAIKLTEQEVATLEYIVQEGAAPQTQRANAVLLAAQGKAVNEVSASTQLTTRQVNYWLNQYASRGLGMFPGMAGPDGVKRPHRPQLAQLDQMGVLADDPMSEAGRKVMAFHLARLLKEENDVRDESQSEAIHDMRVATRRMRSVLDIFGPFYRKHVTKLLYRDLRKLGRALGTVRDLEVVHRRVEHDAEAMEDSRREGLQPLLDAWKGQLSTGRKDLIDLLDKDRYADFLDIIVEFVTTPGSDAVEKPAPQDPTPFLVRHVAPVLIYQQYEAVRAYEPFLGGASLDTLHALRIETKRLRYTVEAFEEVLTPNGKRVIEAAKALQDHLGQLQDTRIATGLMQAFVRHADEYEPVTAILQYVAVREEEKQRLLAEVTQSWEAFAHPDIRRALSRSIALL